MTWLNKETDELNENLTSWFWTKNGQIWVFSQLQKTLKKTMETQRRKTQRHKNLCFFYFVKFENAQKNIMKIRKLFYFWFQTVQIEDAHR